MPRARAYAFTLVLSALAVGAPLGAVPSAATELPGDGRTIGGVADYSLSCRSGNLTREFHLTVSATAPSVARVGDSVSLQPLAWSLEVPGAAFDAALRAGDVQLGAHVTATVRATIEGSGTLEGTRAVAPRTITLTPLASDASGRLRPVVGSATLDATSWTAVGGSVAFRPGEARVDLDLGTSSTSTQCVPGGSHPILTTAVVPRRSAGASNDVLRVELRVPLLEAGSAVPGPAPSVEPEAQVEDTVTERPATEGGGAVGAEGAAVAGPGSPLARTGPGPAGGRALLVAAALIELGYLLTAVDRRRRPSRLRPST